MTEISETREWNSFREVVAAIVEPPLRKVEAQVGERLDAISRDVSQLRRESSDIQAISQGVQRLETTARQQSELSGRRDADSAQQAEHTRAELSSALNGLGEQVARSDQEFRELLTAAAAALTQEVRSTDERQQQSAASVAAMIRELSQALTQSRHAASETMGTLTHEVSRLGEQTNQAAHGVIAPLSARLRRQEIALRVIGLGLLLLIAATIVLAVRVR